MKLLLIDGNSIGFAAHQGAKLHSGGNETQAIFGFVRTMRNLVRDHRDAEPIIYWDGRSWRKEVFKPYKANRDLTDKQRAERESYRQQRPHMARAAAFLGLRMSSAQNLEADDLIALTVAKFDGKAEMKIVTGDKDLLQLVRPGVVWHDPGTKQRPERRISHHEFAEFTGYAGPEEFVQGKALLGDISDNLKGVDGIGEKSAPILLQEFGSVREAIMKIRHDREAAIPESLKRYRKKLLAFAGEPGHSTEGVERWLRNMRLMSLLNPEKLPRPENLRNVNRPFDGERFGELCEEFAFISILKDFDTWTRPFRARHEPQKEAA